MPRSFSILLRQRLNKYVFKVDLAFGIVALQGKSAIGDVAAFPFFEELGVVGFGIINYYLIIQFDDHSFALYDDFFGKPNVVFYQLFLDIFDAVETAGSAPVGVGVVDLHFESLLRPAALLVSGMKIDPRIGAGLGHHIGLEVEVFKRMSLHISLIKQVRRLTVDDDHSTVYFKGGGIVPYFPVFEGFPVEEGNPAIGLGLCGTGKDEQAKADRV